MRQSGKTRPKMLMVTPLFPWPANTGGLVRISEIFKGLSKFFNITFVVPYNKDCNPIEKPSDADAQIIKVPTTISYYPRLLRGLFSLNPFHCEIYASRELSKSIYEHIATNPYDVAYLHFFYSLQYLPPNLNFPILVDQQNVDFLYWRRKAESSSGFRRLFFLWNLYKTKRYESRQLNRIWAYVSVSEEDLKITESYASPQVDTFLLAPNGVDTNHFTPINWFQRVEKNCINLAFMGSLDLASNVSGIKHFYKKIFPRVYKTLPHIAFKLLLIGRSPHKELQSISKDDSRVSLTGTVPDVAPFLRQADILVAPLYEGAGTKLRVLEAMSCALPVVGTNIAVQGIRGKDGEHFLSARDDISFARAICELAVSRPRRAELGYNARRLMEDNFDWNKITDSLSHVIIEALARTKRKKESCGDTCC